MIKFNIPLLIIMSLLLITNILPQLVQAMILGAISLYVIFVWIKNMEVSKYMAYFLLAVSFSLVYSLIHLGSLSSMYYLLSELKILALFTLPVAFFLLLRNTDPRQTLISFYKILSVLVLIVVAYGYLRYGALRYTGFLGHSIYLSICLTVLMSYLYHDTKSKWKLITLVNVFMLGSSSGFLLFFVVLFLKSKLPILVKVLPLMIGIYASYWFAVDFRGRAITDGGFFEIDRVQIILSVVYYAINNFNILDYFIGFGIGVPLEGFGFNNPYSAYASPGFVNWFENFTIHGVYPFAFHNEFLRIFFNFGFFGISIIFVYLWKNLDKTTLIVLAISFLTNTIIYSTVGVIIISLLIAVTSIERLKKKNNLQLISTDTTDDLKSA